MYNELLEVLDIFLFGQEGQDIQRAWLGAVISLGGSIVSGVIGSNKAKQREREARKQKQQYERKLASLEKNRQPIINPYESYKDLSSMISNQADKLSNPYESLSVATKAAEIEIEQIDISLANTLDTLMATGSSAGGATALAQAALQAKRGVSASIEKQEIENERLKAQGEEKLQTQKLAERIRVEEAKIDQVEKVQEADALGAKFKFEAREERELTQLDRMQALIDDSKARELQAQEDRDGILSGAIGDTLGSLGGLITSGAFKSSKSSKSGGGTKTNS